jgi:hypothetical protein
MEFLISKLSTQKQCSEDLLIFFASHQQLRTAYYRKVEEVDSLELEIITLTERLGTDATTALGRVTRRLRLLARRIAQNREGEEHDSKMGKRTVAVERPYGLR